MFLHAFQNLHIFIYHFYFLFYQFSYDTVHYNPYSFVHYISEHQYWSSLHFLIFWISLISAHHYLLSPLMLVMYLVHSYLNDNCLLEYPKFRNNLKLCSIYLPLIPCLQYFCTSNPFHLLIFLIWNVFTCSEFTL